MAEMTASRGRWRSAASWVTAIRKSLFISVLPPCSGLVCSACRRLRKKVGRQPTFHHERIGAIIPFPVVDGKPLYPATSLPLRQAQGRGCPQPGQGSSNHSCESRNPSPGRGRGPSPPPPSGYPRARARRHPTVFPAKAGIHPWGGGGGTPTPTRSHPSTGSGRTGEPPYRNRSDAASLIRGPVPDSSDGV